MGLLLSFSLTFMQSLPPCAQTCCHALSNSPGLCHETYLLAPPPRSRPISTPKKGVVSVMDGKLQQLTTATIAITPNTTNRNLPDSIFIASAGLAHRPGIIKPKFSECSSF